MEAHPDPPSGSRRRANRVCVSSDSCTWWRGDADLRYAIRAGTSSRSSLGPSPSPSRFLPSRGQFSKARSGERFQSLAGLELSFNGPVKVRTIGTR